MTPPQEISSDDSHRERLADDSQRERSKLTLVVDDDDNEEVTTKLTLRAYPAKVKTEHKDGVALPRVDLKSDP